LTDLPAGCLDLLNMAIAPAFLDTQVTPVLKK
jgi:hypothetical protein